MDTVKNAGIVETSLKTLARGSLLMIEALYTPSKRGLLNPAAAFDEARCEVEQSIEAPGRNTGGKPSTPIAPTL